MPSTRAEIVTRRTYNRPLDADGTQFETWEQTIDRVIGHQRWLWSRATGFEWGGAISPNQEAELEELRGLMLARKVEVAGRTLWLGGTDIAKRREASQFNCSFTKVETVYDVVDVMWLLLQGCGVGFSPVVGTINGFAKRMKVEVIRSERTEKGGRQENAEDVERGVWTISVGDSAEAWAKAIGKLVAGKHSAHTLRLDFREIRPAGGRLNGYGWICSGDAQLAKAMYAIAQIFNRKAGALLSRINILDIINWLGTTLSSRRSAEIALMPYGEEEWVEFATAKRNWWEKDEHGADRAHRQQSNNSLLFKSRPSKGDLQGLFQMIQANGGSEPGFLNAAAATARAPWFQGVNPCGEIILPNKGFCNLVEIDVGAFRGDMEGLQRAAELAARANYRQTCVNLKDGILQEAWHLNNWFLRLCGVGLTGIVRRDDLKPYDYESLSRIATAGAFSMADELGTPRPKNVTTVKPSGTLSKIMDTTSGMHKPLGRYVIENTTYSKHDPLVARLASAGYRVFPRPDDDDAVLVALPVEYPDVEFEDFNGTPVNLEPAVAQLERYKMLMRYWCQQNVSSTIYYDASEIPAIVDWLHQNWDEYVGVSFMPRTDPTKTAKDLGYAYLPQEVITREAFLAYTQNLQPIDIEAVKPAEFEDDASLECAGGVCPVK